LSRSAIAHFRELLQSKYWQETHATVGKARDAIALYPFNTKTFVIRPYFIEPVRYAALQRAALLVFRAVVAVGDRVLGDAELRRRLMLTPEEETHVASEIDPREPYGRVDGLIQ